MPALRRATAVAGGKPYALLGNVDPLGADADLRGTATYWLDLTRSVQIANLFAIDEDHLGGGIGVATPGAPIQITMGVGRGDFSLRTSFNINVTNAIADFGHSLNVGLILPEGVTFTADDLTLTPPSTETAPVPEPARWPCSASWPRIGDAVVATLVSAESGTRYRAR